MTGVSAVLVTAGGGDTGRGGDGGNGGTENNRYLQAYIEISQSLLYYYKIYY